MSDVHSEIVAWLHVQQHWLQVIAEKIIHHERISDDDIRERCTLLKTQEGLRTDIKQNFSKFVHSDKQYSQIRIESIGEIEGIDNLAPSKPLQFGKSNLTVIYGNNGSGKSGYTRILNKLCGKPNATDLKPNVFEQPPAKQQCTIGYSIDGDTQVNIWAANSEAIEALRSIDIFDAYTGKIYLDSEADAAYIPEAVALFEDMATVCKRMKMVLESEKKLLSATLLPTQIPYEYLSTKHILAMQQKLKPGVNQEKLKEFFIYTNKDDKNKIALEERLKGDPITLAREKRQQIQQVKTLLEAVHDAISSVDTDACQKIFQQQEAAKNKRKIAIEGAKVSTENLVLSGVGTETWIALWQAAKEYSIAQAYPNLQDNDHCVLCHQNLNVDAKQRLQDFESFVNSTLETEAKEAEINYQIAINNLPTIPTTAQLTTSLRAAQLEETKWLSVLKDGWKSIQDICNQLKLPHEKATIGYALPEARFQPFIEIIKTLEEQIAQHDADVLAFNSTKLTTNLNDLKAKQWVSGYLLAIIAEVERLNQVKSYDDWLKLTNTQAISLKAGEISESVITQAYIDRFNTELHLLGANNIKVELIRTKVEKGRAKHKVQLRGLVINKIKTPDVLSEGERRIVSLAAFLADMAGKPQTSPFIFDDPISSLDQSFEEKTIDRLIELSTHRQVIVFTHRISFLGIINDKASSDQIHIKKEAWGCGEHGEIPFFAKNPIKALKNLKENRLQKAKKILSTEGYDQY